jgi:F5/8 type C domain
MSAETDFVVWNGDVNDLDGWSTSAAPGSACRLTIESGPTGRALRIDYELAGPGAWVIARRSLEATLPDHYVAALHVRGEGPPNSLQVKLVDRGGTNVWWWRRPDFEAPRASSRIVFRRAGLEFAWGPAGGGEPRDIGSVELAVAAGQGGSATLWIEDLRIESRAPSIGPPRICGVSASSRIPGHEPVHVNDGDDATSWKPDPGDVRPWIDLDLGRVVEWGGLAVDFGGDGVTPACRLLASDDGVRWVALADDHGGATGRRWLRSETESRFARLELATGLGVAVTEVAVVPIELAVAPVRWAMSLARTHPRGRFPRHLLGEQAGWTVVGGDGDERKGLLGEDGALEIDNEQFTLEPFLWADGRLLTWTDVEHRLALEDGDLPIPSVEWTGGGVRMRITAFAIGVSGRSALVVRYVVEDTGDAPRDARLVVAIRPFQVTPAWQSLNIAGGFAPITQVEGAGARVRVNRARDVVAVSALDAFGAAHSEEGLRTIFRGGLPTRTKVVDPLGFIEAALAFDLHLRSGSCETVVVGVPLFAQTPELPAGLDRAGATTWGDAQLAAAVQHWRTRLAPVPITLPPCAAPFAQSLRASVGWILVDREGPRLQPGPRAYRRSWIRDGAFMATALAEMGLGDEARAFLRWYAPFQYEDGRVPCAVDRRGVDATVEHDSHGELAWGIVEVARLTEDDGFLRELWPTVERAANAIGALRAQRTSDAFRDGPCFGLLPESISHEGYAGRAVHSYWDDFFALCGLGAAVEAARVVGDADAAARITALRDAMRRDLQTSLARTSSSHEIDFLPASVELADFDPTSTAVAFDACEEGLRLPRVMADRTFERYWQEVEARWRNAGTDSYSPYEVRNATALLRLGCKARALALLDWLIAEQHPLAWRQWPEVLHRDRRAPRFLGDLPHGWIAASFVRALRRLIAYERADEGVLVLAAGVPESWVREAPGIRVSGLPTRFGRLDFTMCAESEDRVRTVMSGVRPPGGIVVESPLDRFIRAVEGDVRARVADDGQRVWLPESPAAFDLRY